MIGSVLVANDMPPMPPFMMQQNADKPTKSQPNNNAPIVKSAQSKQPNKQPAQGTFKNKLDSIAECAVLPPMVIFLPPPMEKSLVSCRNEFYKPSIEDATKKLSKLYKKTVTVSKIEIVDDFREVYKVYMTIEGEKRSSSFFDWFEDELKESSFKYCNANLTHCLL